MVGVPKPKRIKDRALLDTYHTMRCLICNRFGCDPEHTKPKGSFGDDVEENIFALCRHHHQEKGQKGITHMAEKYPKYKNHLLSKGWEYDEQRRKWVRYSTKVD